MNFHKNDAINKYRNSFFANNFVNFVLIDKSHFKLLYYTYTLSLNDIFRMNYGKNPKNVVFLAFQNSYYGYNFFRIKVKRSNKIVLNSISEYFYFDIYINIHLLNNKGSNCIGS